MPQLLPNSFTSYSFTYEEEVAACTFTDLQVARLRNEVAIAANELLNNRFEPTDVQGFLQKEAYARGKKDILEYLIIAHETSQKEFMDLQLLAAQNQSE